MANREKKRVLVVGGGVYGTWVALTAAGLGHQVTLVERESELLGRASRWNQARIHGGYHYPRSVLTALRSRLNYPKFLSEFPEAVGSKAKHLYAVSNQLSQISPKNFYQFMVRIGAPIRVLQGNLRSLFDSVRVGEVFEVEEAVFNAELLKEILKKRLEKAGIELLPGHEVLALETQENLGVPGDEIRVVVQNLSSLEVMELAADRLMNCTYSSLNDILGVAGLDAVELRYELAELCLVKVPSEMAELGVTVMCGPFFSVLPFPLKPGLHSLSHVTYTPRMRWSSSYIPHWKSGRVQLGYSEGASVESAFERMRRDAERFVPRLRQMKLHASFMEIKAILPQNDLDDGRPILVRQDARNEKVTSVLGGKIDNIFDLSPDLLKDYL